MVRLPQILGALVMSRHIVDDHAAQSRQHHDIKGVKRRLGTNRIDVDALALIYFPPLRLQPLLGSLRSGLETIGSIDDASAVLVGEAHHSELQSCQISGPLL